MCLDLISIGGKIFLLQIDSKMISILAYVSRAILFPVMRYIELYPSSKFNDEQVVFFYRVCGRDSSDLHYVSNNQRLLA